MLCLCASSFATEISSVEVAGNSTLEETSILARLRSRAGDDFDETTAGEDSKRIAELAGVEYSYYNTETVEDKVKLTFVIVERNIIRAITFEGNSKYKDKTLKNKIGFKIADYLGPILAESGRKALLEFYHKKGFAFVEIAYDAQQLAKGRLHYKIDPGPRVKIRSVKFRGNKALKTSQLKKPVKTEARHFLLWQGYYKEEKLAEDVTKLQKVYQKKGFFDAKIEAQRQFSDDKKKVRITFLIEEGPLYKVDQIDISGNKHFSKDDLVASLKMKTGDAYSQQRAEMDRKRLLKSYRETGFIDSRVEPKRRFVSQDKVDVEFEIYEGQRFRIGRIDITGNENTQDKVVRRVLDEYDFYPGQWYNADMARGDGRGDLERFVRRTVLAESASITASGDKPTQKNGQVNIIEGQTGSVMLGAGLASNSGVIGQLIFEQRNFDAADWPVSLDEFIRGKAFKGAGQNLRISLMPGTEVSEYSLNFTEPYLNDKPISLDMGGSSYERGRESHDEKRTKGYFGFEKRFKNHWRGSIGFKYENVQVRDIDSDAPKEIKILKGYNGLIGVRVGVGRNMVNDKFNPSDGYTISTDYEQIGGHNAFGLLTATHRGYKTLYEDLAERKTIFSTKI
ncbi:MAG: BamA/OMP85 family outer membrane protein, partial [Planctomycetota bacterium]